MPDGETDAEALNESERLADKLGEAVADPLAVGDAATDRDTDADTVPLGDSELLMLAEALRLEEPLTDPLEDGLPLADGLGEGAVVPKSFAVR